MLHCTTRLSMLCWHPLHFCATPVIQRHYRPGHRAALQTRPVPARRRGDSQRVHRDHHSQLIATWKTCLFCGWLRNRALTTLYHSWTFLLNKVNSLQEFLANTIHVRHENCEYSEKYRTSVLEKFLKGLSVIAHLVNSCILNFQG